LPGKSPQCVQTGRLPLLEQVAKKVPAPLVEMTRIEGLGPQARAGPVQGAQDPAARGPRRAARSGRIRELPGFGARTEQLIATRAERAATAEHRLRLA